MSKGHRDNHAARVKRGPVAFKKKAQRRSVRRVKCNLCGTASRPSVLTGGICPVCLPDGRPHAGGELALIRVVSVICPTHGELSLDPKDANGAPSPVLEARQIREENNRCWACHIDGVEQPVLIATEHAGGEA